jgi:hypothetical protein
MVFRSVAKIYLLRSASERIAEYFYVDSRADYTLTLYHMGRFLGLERIVSEVKEIGRIGGVIAVRFAAAVPMRIGTHQFDCTIAWTQIERVPFLLGRKDVFGYNFSTEKEKDYFYMAKG